jgi:micrococcal nuclease
MARRRSRKWSLPGIVLVALLAAFFNPADQTATHGDFEVVERVVDGDTLLLASGERARLIGVDTPETKHPKKPVERFGKEASEFTRHMVEGKRVRLELDPANAATSHKDNTPQKRTLAYVFLDDGRLLNAEIIKQGYGFALTRFSFSRMEEFRRLEHEAREQGEVVGGEVIGN